jgi:hypothetical protein
MKLKNQGLVLLLCFVWFSFGAATGMAQKIPEIWLGFLTGFVAILALILTVVFIRKSERIFTVAVVAAMLALSGYQVYVSLIDHSHIGLILGAVFALIAALCVIIDFPIIWEETKS